MSRLGCQGEECGFYSKGNRKPRGVFKQGSDDFRTAILKDHFSFGFNHKRAKARAKK